MRDNTNTYTKNYKPILCLYLNHWLHFFIGEKFGHHKESFVEILLQLPFLQLSWFCLLGLGWGDCVHFRSWLLRGCSVEVKLMIINFVGES